MEISYRYVAKDDRSYNELANYLINSTVDVSLFPCMQTIVVAPNGEQSAVIEDVARFIEQGILNFRIEPIDGCGCEILTSDTVDARTLRKVIESMKEKEEEAEHLYVEKTGILEQTLEETTKNKEKYLQWWQDAQQRESRIKEQIKAIGVLLGSIYPDRI